ncbi:MAG: hypothetical protein JXD23_10250 [Spirochaetales bacterium]|nr:hypothetical protein [Spirochaetales bacterium]
MNAIKRVTTPYSYSATTEFMDGDCLLMIESTAYRGRIHGNGERHGDE